MGAKFNDVEIVKFDDVKDELMSHFRRKMLIPVLGSGFTVGCQSHHGTVPSGEEYRQYMIDHLVSLEVMPSEEAEELTFSEACEYYYDVVDASVKKIHLKNNFTDVCLPQSKKNFLSIDWFYIYTLNIDDAIENNSKYNCVVCCNRTPNEDVFKNERCVVKLHGDVWEEIKYDDDKTGIIFSKTQYLNSLHDNEPLLNRLKHDNTSQNLIYIGCSLNDEIDLLSIQEAEEVAQVKRYICLTKAPTQREKIKYKRHGITHCVIFDSFDAIYDGLYGLYKESQKVSCDELSKHSHFEFNRCSDKYDENKSYFLFGKSLLNKDGGLTYPYYFISRRTSDKIIRNMEKHSVQFLMGRGCSGKTYVLYDLAYKIRDRDLYIFESKDRLTEQAFSDLLSRRNSVILFDNSSLSKQQVEFILYNIFLIKERNIKLVICINKNDREIRDKLFMSVEREIIPKEEVPIVELNHEFTKEECDEINPLLTILSIGVFYESQTLLDNILRIGRNLNEKNCYYRSPKTGTTKELVSLISLLIERKVYSSRAIMFDIYPELEAQRKCLEPLIDLETTWSFERNSEDPSTLKYVLNAEYWLCNQLSAFSENDKNRGEIVKAYKYIIEKIIANGEGPRLGSVNEKGTYKQYILFDNINRIFNAKDRGYSGLKMVQAIYEGLNELLAVDPNYMHQRAKCYIKLARYEKDTAARKVFLEKAYRDINVAIQIFQKRYNESDNEHILISIDHLKYTQALVACHRCRLEKYSNISQNTEAVYVLHEAMMSPYNSYEYAKQDSFNYDNVIFKLVSHLLANTSLVKKEAVARLEELFKMLSI